LSGRPISPGASRDTPILLGTIGRAHGVRGHVRVCSHTADPTALTGYGPLSDGNGRTFAVRWIGQGIAEIAEIVDGVPREIADRAQAERLTNTKLFIERSRLPPPDDDEYYLADLIGLTAVDTLGNALGIISAVHDFGAGASLEIARDRSGPLLVPFTAACVPEVNIDSGLAIVVPPDEIDLPGTHLGHRQREADDSRRGSGDDGEAGHDGDRECAA
jgi:16S rRNA processing protein RimM